MDHGEIMDEYIQMNENRMIRNKNYNKFRHASLCDCIECRFSKFNSTTIHGRLVDYFNPEDHVDENGWF